MIGRTTRTTPLELSGGRIRLRTLSEDDYESWFEVRARCRRWLVPWEPRPAGAPLDARGPRQLRGPLRRP